eukprot:TRINITY_DN989_c1_g1_i1.p2 TRINITY_DN989_c1_g1~~TRINITY_DN989_c1_g1_i1.p2  ORF type:complete len:171 (-),score=21.64 TRINITY_DN989_c1_g1_i1:174-686(-)
MQIPQVVKYVGFAVAGGLGIYYVQAFYYISTAQGMQSDAQQLVDTINNEKKQLENQSVEVETRIATLHKTREIQDEELDSIAQKITQARKKLSELEEEQREKQNKILESEEKILSNRKRLADIRIELKDMEGSITMSERSLREAKQGVDLARQNLNPLKHPQFRKLMGSS